MKLILLFIFINFAWAQAPQPAPAPMQAPIQPGAAPTDANLMQMVMDPNFMAAPPAVFDPTLFENLKIHKNTLPLEFELFWNFIYKTSEIDPDKEYLVEASFKLNHYFKTMPKETRIILLKSEIVRNILEFRFDKFSSNLDINNFVIDKAIQKIKKFKKQYNEASLFVINSCIGDLAKYYDEEILNNLKLIKGKLSYKEALKVQDIKAKMKYLRPWFYFFDKLSPGEFNDIVLDLAFEALKNIETKAFLLSYFAPAKPNNEKIFELPEGLPYQTSLFKIVPQEEPIPTGAPQLDINTNQMINELNIPPAQALPTGVINQIEQGLAPQYVPAAQ